MKKNELRIGKKYKLICDITDADGALYKGDEVTLLDWTEVGKLDEHVILTVKDITDRKHTVNLKALGVL